MGIISIERVDNLIWLGRYSERVYITIKEFFSGYDTMMDDPDFYQTYCEHMTIPNIYSDIDDFIKSYVADENNVDSILSNLYRGYDNVVVLRNEIGTESISYLELALNQLKNIEDYDSFIFELQIVVDYILAFWACLEENVQEYEVRSMIILGKRIERLDMYLRLRRDKDELMKALDSLESRFHKNSLPFNLEHMNTLKALLNQDELDYESAIACVEHLI